MQRYCRYEPGYFDDREFESTQQGFVHTARPRHYARTGMLVVGPSVDPSAYWVPFNDVLGALAREATEPLDGFAPRIVTCLDSDADATGLRLEILRLTDRLSNEDLRAVLDHLRRRLSGGSRWVWPDM